ncbi:MAG: alpha-hydroxy-acid oxidizing protein [Lachnospiraceae bacterium]|nr:alpha-hydroxy-acid oxidizing protein [Lachnospiraceae bacterium]
MYTRNTDELTREYFDSIMVVPRYLDGDIPDISIEFFGKKYNTPVMTAALSHLHNTCENGMCEYAKGALMAHALHFVGMSEDDEFDEIAAVGADTVKIVKPHADESVIFTKIERAVKAGAVAVGMDIDHSISSHGTYDNVMGLPMEPKTTEQLESYVKAAGVPFIVKGVLSVDDAYKCVEAGAAGIIISHHHGIMDSMVPPLYMLPAIKKAVGDSLKIIVDCGFESGMDVYKALALGADGVGIGRALMGPLKGGGEAVYKRIEEINCELKTVMARTGFKSVKDINSSALRFRTF